MRKFILLLALLAILPCTARAQSLQLFGGYSYLRLNPAGSGSNFNLSGWEASGTLKNRWLGFTADFSGNYGTAFGSSTSLQTFLFGPQLSLPLPVFSPFVHALVGGARETVGGSSDTAFATAVGGGLDTHIAPFLSYRLIQVDYLVTRFGGNSQNQLRISTGLVLHF